MLPRTTWLPACSVQVHDTSALVRVDTGNTVSFRPASKGGTFDFFYPLFTIAPGVTSAGTANWRALVQGIYVRAECTAGATVSAVSLWEWSTQVWAVEGLSASIVDQVHPSSGDVITRFRKENPTSRAYKDWFFPLTPMGFAGALCVGVEVVMPGTKAGVVLRGCGVETLISSVEARA